MSLSLNNISKKIDKKIIINDFSLDINSESRVVLFAPSGAGKSMLIDIISGYIDDYQGKISNKFKTMLTVFQNSDLLTHKTVWDNIIYSFTIKKQVIDQNISRDIENWLEICDMTSYKSYFPHQISAGMRQKVALMRALVANPKFILLDESFNSIDIQSKIKIMKYIKKKYRNMAVLFITHNIEEAILFGTEIYLFLGSIIDNNFVKLSGKDVSLDNILQYLKR